MLKDIQILPGYNTSINDIGKEFYSPVLSESVSYDRVSGYFSSTSLAYYATGLELSLKNMVGIVLLFQKKSLNLILN
ncbi:hypothetical protein N568_0102320 [Lactococcus garvieae TRF1]|uniref:Uncharacterized protein n=1 Tax=Lactococcus garvieae TRF1 TaxID=1380772 RepID=V8AR10_9LACT|nr:hypothetical protein N568_0102320 [Lactococcus garvieae TRF1]